MERRQVIKRLTGLAALAFLPKQHIHAMQQKKPIHIVGLGSAGTRVMELCYNSGLGDVYSAITNSSECELEGVQVIHYKHELSVRERVLQEINHPEAIVPFALPDETLNIFTADHRYVLLAGLGGYTGTHMSKEIIPLLQRQGKDFKAIFSLPFVFQGKNVVEFAKEVIDQYFDLPQIKFFNSELIREEYGDMPIKSAYKKVDEELLEIYKRYKWKRI